MDLKGKVIAVASDHAGFEKKQVILNYFQERGIEYKDFGCYSDESVDYPEFAHAIGEAIDKKEYEIGITFCGSGQGISIAANKHQNVRSATCWNTEIAEQARLHNNANILTMPARHLEFEKVKEIVDIFLKTKFEGGRHSTRIKKI